MDSWLSRRAFALTSLVVAWTHWMRGHTGAALRYLTRVHRGNYAPAFDRLVERVLYAPQDAPASGRTRRLRDAYRTHITSYRRDQGVAALFDSPSQILRSRALVLKAAEGPEKGVLLIDYNFAFPLFARFYDLARVSDRYRLVLEPSWSGYCDLDILCYTSLPFQVLVQALEPRDAAFLTTQRTNLVPIPIAANWWVDHRVMRPLPQVRKDVDLIMVASWAPFKRHHRFFAALARLAKRGHRPSVLLVGYPYQTTRADILAQARHHRVDGQIEFLENLPAEAVNEQYNRARVNVIWSRREGVNRAIIEGMFAQVPCILREGFNYGYRYPYVNEATGCYADEDTLPDVILDMLARADSFRPRDWVMQNMTCQIATSIIGDALRAEAARRGEPWTRDLSVKVCHLNTMRYWDEQEADRFAGDYAYLESCLR